MIEELDCNLRNVFCSKEAVAYNEAVRLSEKMKGDEDYRNVTRLMLRATRIEFQKQVLSDLSEIISDEIYIELLNELFLNELKSK